MSNQGTSLELKTVRWGIVLSLLAVFFGFMLGGLFGGLEESLKGDLKSRAETALESAYGGDRTKLTATVDKAWVYYQRAHLHGGAIGTASLAAAMLLAAMSRPPRALCALTAAAMGLGALGYSIYWLAAGYTAVEIGSTSAAKEALEWLAVPSAGMVIVGLALVLVMSVWQWFVPSKGG